MYKSIVEPNINENSTGGVVRYYNSALDFRF
jgi:hypothetical protein